MNLETMDKYRVLSITEVLELTGKTRSTFWRHRKEGRAPRCLMDGKRVIGVTVGDFIAWQESMRDVK